MYRLCAIATTSQTSKHIQYKKIGETITNKVVDLSNTFAKFCGNLSIKSRKNRKFFSFQVTMTTSDFALTKCFLPQESTLIFLYVMFFFTMLCNFCFIVRKRQLIDLLQKIRIRYQTHHYCFKQTKHVL